MKKAWWLGFLTLIIFYGIFFFSNHLSEKQNKQEKLIRPPTGITATEVPPIFPKEKIKDKIFLKEPGDFYLLPQSVHTYQTWNNCGPATLSMVLSLYGIKKTQKEIGDYLRPVQNKKGQNDDKAVFPREIIAYLKSQGLEGKFLVNGSPEKLKKLLANDIPIMTRQLLKITDDPSHYRLIRGFNEKEGVFIVDDSYFGPNFKINYQRFNDLWRPLNYGYIVVYKSDKEKVMAKILGEEIEEKVMYRNALKRAKEELKSQPNNVYSLLNLGESYFYLGDYPRAREAFEKAQKIGLSRRILWYHLEPIMVYNKLKEYDKVLDLTEKIFESGNPAFSEGYYERGLAYLGKGEKEKAKEEFEKAVFYNENYKEAKEELLKL